MTILYYINRINIHIRSLFIRLRFRHIGNKVCFSSVRNIIGTDNIFIGDNTEFGRFIRLNSWNKGVIEIGENCHFGDNNFITAYTRISIGNNILTGNNVLISDNSHGKEIIEEIVIPPIDRKIFSKGPITIGNNVWIGQNVCILANVTIGDGAIIGANSVVTHDVPPHCVAVGSPARIIKEIK